MVFSFDFLVCDKSLFEVTYIYTQCNLMYNKFKQVPRTPQNISKALPYLIGNIFLLSKMGISRFFIWILGLRDIVDWSNICQKNGVHVSPEIQQIFSLSLGHHRESMLYGWKGLFKISNGSSIEFNFIICIRSYEWICIKTSIAPKIMNF